MNLGRWAGRRSVGCYARNVLRIGAKAAPLGSAAEGLRETANQNALTQELATMAALLAASRSRALQTGIGSSTATTTATVIPITAATVMVRASTSISAEAGTTIIVDIITAAIASQRS